MTIWLNPEALATPLVVAFIDAFGVEPDPEFGISPLEWEPTTVMQELLDRTGGKPIPQETFDRLMAGRELIRSDKFYQSLPDFVELANVLAGSLFEPELFDPADSAECAWAVLEAALLNGPEEIYIEDIQAYITTVMTHDGLPAPPKPLESFATNQGWTAEVRDYDDPVLFGAVQAVGAEKLKSINEWLMHRSRILAKQLEELKLQNGKAITLDELRQLSV